MTLYSNGAHIEPATAVRHASKPAGKARKPASKAASKPAGKAASKARKAAVRPAKAQQSPSVTLGEGITATYEGRDLVLRIRADQAAIDKAPLGPSGRVKVLAASRGWQTIDRADEKPLSVTMVVTARV